MRRNDPPDPDERDACKVFTESDDVETRHSAGKICRRARLAEFADFFMPIKILRDSESQDAVIGPKHFYELFHIVVHKGALILRIQLE